MEIKKWCGQLIGLLQFAGLISFKDWIFFQVLLNNWNSQNFEPKPSSSSSSLRVYKILYRPKIEKVRVFQSKSHLGCDMPCLIKTNNDIQCRYFFLTGFPRLWLVGRSKASCAPIGQGVWGPSLSQRHVPATHKASLPVAYFRFSLFQRFLSGVGVIRRDLEPKSECAVISDLGNSGEKCH